MVDGCGPLGALFRVVVPAAIPGIVAVAVYAFMTAWGEVLFASVMTNDTTRTLAVGLQGYSTQNDVYWNQVMAASLVVSVPGGRRLPAPPALPRRRADRRRRQVTSTVPLDSRKGLTCP